MKVIVILCAVAASLLSCSPGGDEPTNAATAANELSSFLWRPDSISVTIERDDQFLRMGQFALLQQELREGESGWSMMKLDLPDGWKIEDARVENASVVIRLAAGQVFRLDRTNVGKLASRFSTVATRPTKCCKTCG